MKLRTGVWEVMRDNLCFECRRHQGGGPARQARFNVLNRVREWLLRLLRRDVVRCGGFCFFFVSPAARSCLLTIRAETPFSVPRCVDSLIIVLNSSYEEVLGDKLA